jgi:hypothetical protein
VGLSEVVAIKHCLRCGETKPVSEFTIRSSGAKAGRPVAHCKECRADSVRGTYSVKNDRDPTLYRRVESPSKLRRLYGLTVDDYYRLLAAQGGGCGVCGSLTPGGRAYKRRRKTAFSVDHCHTTGRVRGLLCDSCNRALGLIGDNPRTAAKMAEYLK